MGHNSAHTSRGSSKRLCVYQLNVKSVFLHGELNEDLFVKHPQGFEIKGEDEYVYKLRKPLFVKIN